MGIGRTFTFTQKIRNHTQIEGAIADENERYAARTLDRDYVARVSMVASIVTSSLPLRQPLLTLHKK